MKKFKKFLLVFSVLSLIPMTETLSVAKQSAIKMGTTVRTRMEPVGLYSQECYDFYYSCMDQFCISDNVDGGSCACSDLNAGYEAEIADIQLKLSNANDIKTIEVEKIMAGADADIIFSGTRQYDEYGNVISLENLEAEKESEKNSLLSMFDNSYLYDGATIFDDFAESDEPAVGAELYKTANNLCKSQIPKNCATDLILLEQTYSRQIVSDCKGFENTVARKNSEADMALADAYAAVRSASKQSLESANKYNAGECMVEFKQCMQTDDACGKNWENCVTMVATESMQNNAAKSTAGTSVSLADSFDINVYTMESLDSKRNICEGVLDQCVAVRDTVWPAFLREAAPTIRLAELKLESTKRQSCLTDISDCIQTACRDDIAGRGTATMDACLSRPDMARSFCKVEIDTCERMEPLIWGYVTDKLAAMRVDACTSEVKECFTSPDRCGTDFGNCIGVDYEVVKNMCPVDKLVVCKANNPDFEMSDLDNMLAGLYLNIDNAALENCQTLVDDKMMEICGSTTDCNRFAADDTIGTSSLKPQKVDDIYRITGMISFGQIKMGMSGLNIMDDGKVLGSGEIGVQDYINAAYAGNRDVPNREVILESIEAELENIAGSINRTISMIEQDPQVQYCLYGRDENQESGKFPNLMNQYKQQIAIAALRVANDNYNEKLNAEIASATTDAEIDVAQYMCQILPMNSSQYAGADVSVDVALAPPYSISYEIATGVNADDIMFANTSVRELAGGSLKSGDYSEKSGFAQAARGVGAAATLGLSNDFKVNVDLPGGSVEKWSVFSRETRVCRLCTSTITKSCTTENSKGFLGIGSKNNMDCVESEPIEVCQDIQM